MHYNFQNLYLTSWLSVKLLRSIIIRPTHKYPSMIQLWWETSVTKNSPGLLDLLLNSITWDDQRVPQMRESLKKMKVAHMVSSMVDIHSSIPLLALSKPLTALNSINYWFQKHNFAQKKSNLMTVECCFSRIFLNLTTKIIDLWTPMRSADFVMNKQLKKKKLFLPENESYFLF